MIDGTYTMQINTPFGRKPGTVVMRTQGDAVFADIDAPIVGTQHVQGRAEGNTFAAAGSFKLGLMGKVDYSLRGEVAGDLLRIAIDSSKGSFTLSGARQ